MSKLVGLALHVAALPGIRGTNVHVAFGNVADCVAPPAGNCGNFTIDFDTSVVAGLTGFVAALGDLHVTSINYYGAWWSSNVGTNTAVAADFCTSGAGASQTATSHEYPGITIAQPATPGQEGDDEWSLTSASMPNHDCEDYCSAAGGRTPPLLGTLFTRSYRKTFSLRPSTTARGDISNEVGYAVNGVVIFSPFTRPGGVAAYDETLDTCTGHPANNKYHYHGFTPCLHGESGTQTGDSIPHSKIYGFAFDGFPIYGPYGYTDGNDNGTAVVRVTGGYVCTADGAPCTTDGQKSVTANWAYASSNGMLDDCNGRWTKTPEFPDGMYVYVLNIQENGKPDFPGVPYCVQGAGAFFDSSALGSSPGPLTGSALLGCMSLLLHSFQ